LRSEPDPFANNIGNGFGFRFTDSLGDFRVTPVLVKDRVRHFMRQNREFFCGTLSWCDCQLKIPQFVAL
jgi:hypothetical protein